MRFKVSGLDDLEKAFREDFKSACVEFGYGPKSGKHSRSGVDYSYIAHVSEWGGVVNVYGYDGIIPPRPFFSETIDNYIPRTGEVEHGMIRNGVFRSEWVVDTICADLRYALKETIAEWSDPPNAPLTIERKGFNDPLVETGKLWNAAVKQGKVEVYEV